MNRLAHLLSLSLLLVSLGGCAWISSSGEASDYPGERSVRPSVEAESDPSICVGAWCNCEAY